jgi:hypothetical protein
MHVDAHELSYFRPAFPGPLAREAEALVADLPEADVASSAGGGWDRARISSSSTRG